VSHDHEAPRDEAKRRHPWASMGWELWGLGASMGSAAAAVMLLFALVVMLRFA
jgi:hypothetical protein